MLCVLAEVFIFSLVEVSGNQVGLCLDSCGSSHVFEGDIYSFGMVLYALSCGDGFPIWCQAGGFDQARNNISNALRAWKEAEETSTFGLMWYHLVKECLMEEPEKRPTVQDIGSCKIGRDWHLSKSDSCHL